MQFNITCNFIDADRLYEQQYKSKNAVDRRETFCNRLQQLQNIFIKYTIHYLQLWCAGMQEHGQFYQNGIPKQQGVSRRIIGFKNACHNNCLFAMNCKLKNQFLQMQYCFSQCMAQAFALRPFGGQALA